MIATSTTARGRGHNRMPSMEPSIALCSHACFGSPLILAGNGMWEYKCGRQSITGLHSAQVFTLIHLWDIQLTVQSVSKENTKGGYSSCIQRSLGAYQAVS